MALVLEAPSPPAPGERQLPQVTFLTRWRAQPSCLLLRSKYLLCGVWADTNRGHTYLSYDAAFTTTVAASLG
jgi:hypothetical protein